MYAPKMCANEDENVNSLQTEGVRPDRRHVREKFIDILYK